MTIVTNILGSLSPPRVAPATPTSKSSSGLKWKVNALDSLSLSVAGLQLGSGELSKLPSSLLNRVYDGYSKVLQANDHLIPENLNSIRFSVADNQLIVKSSAGDVVIPFTEETELQETLAKVVDKARVHFPESFKKQRELPTATAMSATAPKAKPFLNWDAISEVNSTGRNAAALTAAAVTMPAVIGLSGLAGAGLNLALGYSMIRSGKKTYDESTEIGDTGGRIDGALTAGIGASFGAVGVTMVAGFAPSVITSLQSTSLAAPAVANAFSMAGAAAISLMAVFMFAKTVHSWSELSDLRDDLTAILNDQEISSETKAKQGITFLAQQIYVTEGEARLLQEKYGSDPKELKTQMENKAKAKWAKFVRNVGPECAAKIAAQIDSVIVGVGSNDPDSLVKAIDLLQSVDKASYQIRVKQAITLFLSFLYLAVGIISLLTPLSPAVAALYMAGAALFLLIDSEWVNDKLNRLVSAMKSDPNKLWKPLTNRVTSEFQIDNKWHVNKLKTRLEEALAKASNVSLRIVGNDGRETVVGKIANFNHLCHWLKLGSVDFSKTAVDYGALTVEQIRALRFLDLLQNGILGVQDTLADYRAELQKQGIDFGPDFELNAETSSTDVQATFNEDVSKVLGEINVVENTEISPQLVDAV